MPLEILHLKLQRGHRRAQLVRGDGKKFLSHLDRSAQLSLQSLSLGDVYARTDVPCELAVGQIPRRPAIQNPAELPIRSAQPVFHLKRNPLVERIDVGIDAI